MKCDVAVVGAGVLGVATAFWLSRLRDCSVVVLDKDSAVGQGATLRNTGIVHRPFYLDPGRKKLFARSAEISHGMWKRLAIKSGAPWNELGVLMVATEGWQLRLLDEYTGWATQNGMKEGECELLDRNQVARVEPAVECGAAVLSKRDASTDFSALTRALWGMASESGASFLGEAEVDGLEARGETLSLSLKDGRSLECQLLVNAAGGGSLDIAHDVGLAPELTDLHFRGEYWEVDRDVAPRVSRSVYSVARHEKFPFLDPHFVVRHDGRREVGPNAVLVAGPETYEGLGGPLGVLSKAAEGPLGPKARLFTNSEFLSLVWNEWRSSLSKRAMCNRVRRFVPSLGPEMLLKRGLPGVRSNLVDRNGFVPEALIIKGDRSAHVLNYNSPGATGAPVFAANLVRMLEEEGYLDSFRAKPPRMALWGYEETLVE